MKIFSKFAAPGIRGAVFAALFTAGSAFASYTVTVTSAQPRYQAGTVQALQLDVHVTTDGSIEFVDNITFAFPPTITVLSASGPQPFNFCGGGQGNYTPTATGGNWSTPGHPSSCGAFATGTFSFVFAVRVPVGTTGPQTIVLTTQGDGFAGPFTTITKNISFTERKAFDCLDIDGNGNLDALSDGLMLLRAILGLTGNSVTNGAIVSPTPPRFSWADMRTYMNSNCGTNFLP